MNVGRLPTFENVPERDQSSFFDDLEERQIINDVVAEAGPTPAGIKSPTGDAFSIGSHLRGQNSNGSRRFALQTNVDDDDTGADKEVSVYALDSAQSISDVTRHHFGADPAPTAQVQTLRVMHCSQLTEMKGLN